ncbi:MAG: hypothetical protein ABIN01_06300 [Ferruginibacter sp.]
MGHQVRERACNNLIATPRRRNEAWVLQQHLPVPALLLVTLAPIGGPGNKAIP